jgi:hypothetical protein
MEALAVAVFCFAFVGCFWANYLDSIDPTVRKVYSVDKRPISVRIRSFFRRSK